MSLVLRSVNSNNLCVICNDSGVLTKAQEWADFFHCPLNPGGSERFFFQFFVTENQVYLRDLEQRVLKIDFDENHLDYQRKGHRGKNELIAKALGVAKGCRKILDLSVGLGIDSVFLTQLGFEVTGVERSPVLYALLKEAFAKTTKDYLKTYQLHFADSLQFLKDNKNKFAVDSIYFDPMYPHKKKTALPKQEMVVFRELVGHDEDASLVLVEALSWPVKRVVVKRPIHAEELLKGVQHSYKGKVVRYDTYVVG